MPWRIDVEVRAKDREGRTHVASSPFDANPRRGTLRRLRLTESRYVLFVIGTRYPGGPIQILRQQIPELRPQDVSADVKVWKILPDRLGVGRSYNRLLNPLLQWAMKRQIRKTLTQQHH